MLQCARDELPVAGASTFGGAWKKLSWRREGGHPGAPPMAEFPKKLVEIAEHLEKGRVPEKTTVRNFLEWFGAQRRGFYVVQNIRGALDNLRIRTDPDFESAYIDALISFVRANAEAATDSVRLPEPPSTTESQTHIAPAALIKGGIIDPTQRIGKLASANKPPLAVKPDAPLREAVTQMLSHDYSQLPVMQNEREVKGVISWASIGSRSSLGRSCDVVRECMDPHHEIGYDTSLFAAIDSIVTHEYVLIRAADRRICGIVTTTDLSLQFLQLGEPFLLLGEIENHIRRLIDGKFTSKDLREAKDPADSGREVAKVSDLTFGEYVRLLENPERWAKLALSIDRTVFVQQLDKVRTIRNDVMHFDPDGLEPSDLETLRHFVHFMEELRTIGLT